MTNKTSLEIECFCSVCSNLLQPKAIRCKSQDGRDCFNISLEPCKHCALKARRKTKKVVARLQRRRSQPIKLTPQPQPQDQEAIMAKHAESGKFGDVAKISSTLNQKKFMKNELKKFRVSLAVSVPMNYEGFAEAKDEKEAIAKMIEDFRENRELGDFDTLEANWKDAMEDFDEEDPDVGTYCEEQDSEESDVAAGVQDHQD